LMKEVYLKLHPNSAPKWDAAIAKVGDERAAAIGQIFGDTRKGDFAQLLTEAITASSTFIVPTYICTAIQAIVK